MSRRTTISDLGIIAGPHELGVAIREARLSLSLTVEQAAERCGVLPKTLMELEQGSWETSIAEAFNVINNIGVEMVVQPMGTAVMSKIIAGDPLEASSLLDEYYGPARPWVFP